MGNISSSEPSSPSPPPSTPASSLFNIAVVPARHRRKSSVPQSQVAYPRRSIFAHDEDEPDDFCQSPRDAVLLGWTRTEAGIIIPQIRSFAMPTPLDDTIFNSPRLPWVEKRRAHSPAPSARSIRMMRQFSIESFPSVRKRKLRVVNVSRPTTGRSMERRFDEVDEGVDSDGESVDWEELQRSKPLRQYTSDDEECDETLRSTSLKRGNSTNDSGYSTMVPDTASCDSSDISEDPWWWEEAAGYSTNIYDDEIIYTEHSTEEPTHYLHEERQETAYLSTLLRSNASDEWAEWSTNVTRLLMIPEEDESPNSQRPATPVNTIVDPTETPRSPTRRRSLFNFAKVTKNIALSKRKSLLW